MNDPYERLRINREHERIQAEQCEALAKAGHNPARNLEYAAIFRRGVAQYDKYLQEAHREQ